MIPITGLFEMFCKGDTPVRWWKLTWVVACFWPLASFSESPAVAAAFGVNIEKAMKESRYAEADKELRSALRAESSNPRWKFLSCVVQAKQASPQKAIGCFQQLVKDHPAMPEAYNNIGVLYAGMGMHVEARKWFERGLTQHMAYATLHQNLLNVQAEMNRSAYAAALQLDISKNTTPPKLSLMAKVVSMPEVPSPPTDAVLSAGKKAVTSVAALDAAPATTADPVKPSAEPKPALLNPAEVSSVMSAQEPRVRELVQAWALAWGQKNIDAYFTAYSSRFNPGSGVSRQSWEEQRRARILSKKQIQIEVTDLKISFSSQGSKAMAVFTQRYESGAIATVSRKTLELAQEKGQWLITREWVSGS